MEKKEIRPGWVEAGDIANKGAISYLRLSDINVVSVREFTPEPSEHQYGIIAQIDGKDFIYASVRTHSEADNGAFDLVTRIREGASKKNNMEMEPSGGRSAPGGA